MSALAHPDRRRIVQRSTNHTAIAQWIYLHADRLRAALPNLTFMPSESTLLCIIWQIDVGLLEAAVPQLTQPHPAADGTDTDAASNEQGRARQAIPQTWVVQVQPRCCDVPGNGRCLRPGNAPSQ